MSSIINPKSTAAWLIDNTILTFGQIADFCDLHLLEVEAIADGEYKITPSNPIFNFQLTMEKIIACQDDPDMKLKRVDFGFDIIEKVEHKNRKKRYKTFSQRKSLPECVLFMITKNPKIKHNIIAKLLGVTNRMIEKVKNGEYKSLVPKDPVLAGFCARKQFEDAVNSEE